MSEAWDAKADEWTAYVRGGADAVYAWHSAAFLRLVPAPGRLTLDVGCGEGRLARDLAARGHTVVGIDASPTMIARAVEADPNGEYVVADAVSLPFEDGSADIVVAFMSLQDVEELGGAVAEAARVLVRGGRLCAAVVHPVWSAGEVEGKAFVIRGSYLELVRSEKASPDGLLTLPSLHRPLEAFGEAFAAAGLLVERLRELPTRRRLPGRIPLFLHLRAVKP